MNNTDIFQTIVDAYFSGCEGAYENRKTSNPGDDTYFSNFYSTLIERLKGRASIEYCQEDFPSPLPWLQGVWNGDQSLILVSARYTFIRERDGALAFGEVSSSSSRSIQLFRRVRRSKPGRRGAGFLPRTHGIRPLLITYTVLMADIPTQRVITVTWLASPSTLETYVSGESELGPDIARARFMFDNYAQESEAIRPRRSKHTASLVISGQFALVFGDRHACDPRALRWVKWREK